MCTTCSLKHLVKHAYCNPLYNKFIGTPCTTSLLGPLVQQVYWDSLFNVLIGTPSTKWKLRLPVQLVN